MRIRYLLVVLCVVCVANVGARADDTKSDKEQLQGAWTLVRGETNGVPLADVLKKGLRIDFLANSMKMSGFGGQDHKYRFKLKPDENPKAIDSVTEETPGKGGKGILLPGIYELDGDTLKLCLASEPTDKRPTEFKAPKGSRVSFLVLTRVKR